MVVRGDSYFTSSDSGLPYGSFWIHEDAVNVDITGAGVDTYVKINGWSEGLMHLVNNNSFALTVDKIGVYQVSWDISGDSQGNNKDYEVDIFFNNVEQDSGSARRVYSSAGSLGSMSGNAIIDCMFVGSDLELRMKQVGGVASDFDIFNANFNIVMIGGT